ncbi:hypothetical protein PXI33_004685, partial [Enterobacter hormaechei]
ALCGIINTAHTNASGCSRMRSDGCTDAINRAEQGVASVRGRICLTVAGLFIYTVSGILLAS